MLDTGRTLPGGGVIDDKRSTDDREATVWYVVATDSFMSGWGQAQGSSYFAVPCKDLEQARIVEDNMEHRSEMKRVRLVLARTYRPKLRSGDHLSIRDMDDCSRFYTVGGFAS